MKNRLVLSLAFFFIFSSALIGALVLWQKPLLIVPTPHLSDSQIVPQTKKLPNYDHIVILVMENKPADVIKGNSAARFLNSLITENSLSNNYYAITNPSLPNYLALIGGDTFGVTTNCNDCFLDQPTLVDSLEKSGKTWKAYMDSMPSPCFTGNAVPYAMKHNPFIYFNTIRSNPERCNKIVPYTQLEKDLKSDSLPHFVWITPDMCHDMHDCSIAVGDQWLATQIPLLLTSPAFTAQKSLLIITWDEGYASDNRIATALIGAHVKKKFSSETFYNHYSLLRTIEEIWGLPTLTNNDKNATPMLDFFEL